MKHLGWLAILLVVGTACDPPGRIDVTAPGYFEFTCSGKYTGNSFECADGENGIWYTLDENRRATGVVARWGDQELISFVATKSTAGVCARIEEIQTVFNLNPNAYLEPKLPDRGALTGIVRAELVQTCSSITTYWDKSL